MTITTKFDFKQLVFFIHNDKIISLPIQGIKYERGTVSYTFCTKKSTTLMDNDSHTIQNEQDCFSSIDDLCQHYKQQNENSKNPHL